MPPLTATPDELLATVQELFPLEYRISYLTLVTTKQQERLAELQAPQPEG